MILLIISYWSIIGIISIIINVANIIIVCVCVCVLMCL